MKLSELVQKYIELRDKKAELTATYKAQAAEIDSSLGKIETKLLQVFDQTGMESVKTEFGTAFAATRSTASVADREIFLNFCREHDEWTLMDVRAAKQAIEQYKAANEDNLPPGINWRVERVVNFRRSA